MLIDISKAHLYAPVDEGTSAYVDLPPECSKPRTCGLLQYWPYGMRPASHGWEAEYTRQLEAIGFVAGAASPCCFHRASDDAACVVHGGDSTFEGEHSSLQEIAKALAKVWLVKIRGTLGPDPGDKETSNPEPHCPMGKRSSQIRGRSQACGEVGNGSGHGRWQIPCDSRDETHYIEYHFGRCTFRWRRSVRNTPRASEARP